MIEHVNGHATVAGLIAYLSTFHQPETTLVYASTEQARAERGDPRLTGAHYLALDRLHVEQWSTGHLDLDRVAALVNEAGVPAYVEQTGGGCATVYAGPTHTDAHGVPRHAAAAGPGTYGWGHQPSVSDLDDFAVGTDDDEPDYLDPRDVGARTEADVAALIVATVQAGTTLTPEAARTVLAR